MSYLAHSLLIKPLSKVTAFSFATDICNIQAIDLMDLKKCRKTYPLCNSLETVAQGLTVRFVQCSGVLMPLDALPRLVSAFQHETIGFKLSNRQTTSWQDAIQSLDNIQILYVILFSKLWRKVLLMFDCNHH